MTKWVKLLETRWIKAIKQNNDRVFVHSLKNSNVHM